MNYGSPSSALFCRVTTLEGDCMRFSAARPIFMPSARLLWCNVAPNAGCTRACGCAYICKHAYRGRFNWYFYACVCKQMPGWILEDGKGRASLQPNTTGATLTVGVKFGSQPETLVFSLWEDKRGSDWRVTPLLCKDNAPLSCLWHIGSLLLTQCLFTTIKYH